MNMLQAWFASPDLLWSLLAVLFAAACLGYAQLRRRRQLAVLAGGPWIKTGFLYRPRVRSGKSACALVGLALLAISAAGPRWGIDAGAQERRGRDVIIVLDLSRSMSAEQPSRLEFALRALHDLADAFEARGGNRFALIGFASQARLFFPLTQDCEHLRHTLEQIALDDYPPLSAAGAASGTRIGAGLSLAAESFDRAATQRPLIVLLSDGDDPAHDDEWMQGVQAALAKNLRVCAVALGDPNRAETIPHGKEVLEYEGEPVRSRLNENRLRDIARRTGGQYLPAHRESLPFGAIVQHWLDAEDAREDAGPGALTVPQLRYAWFLLPALALFGLAFWLGDGIASKPAPGRSIGNPLVIAAAFLGMSAADPPEIDAWIRQGNDAFNRQDYESAVRCYEQVEGRTSDPGLVSFNKAAALARLGRFKEAIDCCRRALDDDRAPPSRRARASFDLGNALMREDANQAILVAQAVQAYRACLAEPGITADLRADARHNLEVAQLLWLKLRREQKQPERDEKGNEAMPKTPDAQKTLEQNDPGKADNAYAPIEPPPGAQAKASADIKPGQASKSLRAGTIYVLPDEEAVVPLPPEDARATLERHAQRIAEERRRQRHPAGSAQLTTKDW